jgi:hypothetical protein
MDRKIRDRIGCNSEKQLNNSPPITGFEVESKKHRILQNGTRHGPTRVEDHFSSPFLLSPFGFFRILARTRRIRGDLKMRFGAGASRYLKREVHSPRSYSGL